MPIDTGDTTWMLISTGLVMMMTPALGFFEAGLIRAKNTLSIIMQTFSGLAILSILWFIIGFTLVFAPSQGGIIGGLDWFFFNNVPINDSVDYAPTIPGVTFASYQMMFAVITPLLITGAFAERLKWSSFFVFIIAWSLVVYYPLAHWIWGRGWLADMGVFDFAGGIVIHTSAGLGSLAAALVLGRVGRLDPPGSRRRIGDGAHLPRRGGSAASLGGARPGAERSQPSAPARHLKSSRGIHPRRHPNRRRPTMRIRSLLFVLAFLAAAAPALAGPPWLSIEMPANPHDRGIRSAFLMVRTYHHTTPIALQVRAVLEGIVDGERVSRPVAMQRTGTLGLWAVTTAPPGESIRTTTAFTHGISLNRFSSVNTVWESSIAPSISSTATPSPANKDNALASPPVR